MGDLEQPLYTIDPPITDDEAVGIVQKEYWQNMERQLVREKRAQDREARYEDWCHLHYPDIPFSYCQGSSLMRDNFLMADEESDG